MELTRSRIRTAAQEYAAEEPFYAVEREHVELLPDTFADDAFGRRDAEWVVQWYYRRHLGGFPDAERREREREFRENDFEDVLATLPAVAGMADLGEQLDALTSLRGVDVPVASAFLQFMFPDRYVVVGEREWETLRVAGELDDYPDSLDAADYERYHATCQRLADRFDVDAWTLYRALWRLGAD